VALGLTWWQLALVIWGVLAIPAALLAYSLGRAAKDGDEVIAAQARTWADAPAGDNWPFVGELAYSGALIDRPIALIDRPTLAPHDVEFTPEAKARLNVAIDDHVRGMMGAPANPAAHEWSLGVPVRTSPYVPRGTVMVMHPDQIEQIIAEFIHRRRPLVRRAPLRRVTRGWTPAGTYTGDPRVA
jgi:hypothetical protein